MLSSQHGIILQAIELIESRIGVAVGKQFHNEFADLFIRLAQGDSPASYLDHLRQHDLSSPQWQRLINTITIGETYFLREQTHFDLLKKHILPKLVLRRRQEGQHTLRIWSAGCSSGEEPYSIAMTLHQFLPDIAKWDIQIFGTDINEYSLQTAINGIYRQWSFRHVDKLVQQNYFDKTEGGLQVKSYIRNMVTFRRHNLLNDLNISKFDIIFCKNVLLYFDDIYIEHAENRIYESLQPDGWLFLGQAEAIRHQRNLWKTHIFPGSPIYQRLAHHSSTVEFDLRNLDLNEDDTQPIIVDYLEESQYTRAVRAVQSDDLALAEHYLSQALSENVEPAKTHTLLAWIFANRKALPEAQAHITATLAIEPLFADAHYVTALLALEQNTLDDAFRALQMTLYCNKHHVLAAFMLGNLLAQGGYLSKAFNQWKRAQSILADFPATEFVSDLSDLTVGQLKAMIDEHLKDV